MAVADSGLGNMVIAVDGTAGAGKSSASRATASRLGMRYLDTGAMYRAITWGVLQAGVPLDDQAEIAAYAASTQLDAGTDPGHPTIALNGRDVSREIRTEPVTAVVSAVSAVPEVRRLMVDRQRREISAGGIVVEGRDIGTTVAPEADVKVFLTADPGARARRRAAQLGSAGNSDLGFVESDLARRDDADSTRAASPLAAARDAIRLDSTDLTLDEVVEAIVAIAKERAAVPHSGEAAAPHSGEAAAPHGG